MGQDFSDVAELALRRFKYLEVLSESPEMEKRRLEDQLNVSRPTINRVINDFSDLGLVQNQPGTVKLTLKGKIQYEQTKAFLTNTKELGFHQDVLASLPVDSDFSVEMLSRGETVIANSELPYQVYEQILSFLNRIDHLKALVPTLVRPDAFRLIADRVTAGELEAEFVMRHSFCEKITSELTKEFLTMRDNQSVSYHVGDIPGFGLAIGTHNDSKEVAALVYDDSMNSIHASIVNDTDSAILWAENLYQSCLKTATDITNEIGEDGWVSG